MPRKGLMWGAGVFTALAALGAGVASAVDDDRPISSDARARAEAAAVEHTGGGTVTETEEDGGASAYEVEVEKADGSVVEVELDRDFRVLHSEADESDDD